MLQIDEPLPDLKLPPYTEPRSAVPGDPKPFEFDVRDSPKRFLYMRLNFGLSFKDPFSYPESDKNIGLHCVLLIPGLHNKFNAYDP